MKKFFILLTLTLLPFTSLALSEEFNENILYSGGKVDRAYNTVDLPMLPGTWKIYDLEKSGSVASGNFYVYATLVPDSFGPNDNATYFDTINYAVLGSKSEETDYRKTFIGCDSSFYTSANVSTRNITSRGTGDFEETCSALAQAFDGGFGNHSFYLADCAEFCVEVNFSLFQNNYILDGNNFDEISERIFSEIRNTIRGDHSGFDFLKEYK